jgi:hypothetical protein
LGNFIANSWVSSHNDTNFFLINPNHSPSYICIYRKFQWRRSRNFISVVKCVKCVGLSAPITWHALFSKRRFADIRGPHAVRWLASLAKIESKCRKYTTLFFSVQRFLASAVFFRFTLYTVAWWMCHG